MSSRSFNFYGIRVVRPKGLRKSPGSSRRNGCIRQHLVGKTGGGQSAQWQRFTDAAKACK